MIGRGSGVSGGIAPWHMQMKRMYFIGLELIVAGNCFSGVFEGSGWLLFESVVNGCCII
jgi:hypothetical protein